MTWQVYILKCGDGSLYTGVTTDVQRRLAEHNGEAGGKKSARYTRVRRPVSLVYAEPAEGRSQACQREYSIKQLTRKQKLELIRTYSMRKVSSTEKASSTTEIPSIKQTSNTRAKS